jgi:uracil phosphoribosyltransferase
MRQSTTTVLLTVCMLLCGSAFGQGVPEGIPKQDQTFSQRFPIVACPFQPSVYERLLMTRLRDRTTSTADFRTASSQIGNILVSKVVECLETQFIDVQTPVALCTGEVLKKSIELVTILRSGDALLDTFLSHFPNASVSKILVQRNEETALPVLSYVKIPASIRSGGNVLVLDPMVATGGTLKMVLSLLNEKGVLDENIIVVCIVACPEELTELCKSHPNIRLVMSALDEKLNEKKYIVPGLGDFGDRYYGTTERF